ncbi:MAG: hypothetical protein P4L74_02455 [Candidatus Doudnabacteria bacterium]|nr:hypothetical protein [Candidatus Doudnabacteria bacterium]
MGMPNIPDKRLLIAVCNFLYQKRLYEPGVLEPITIPLRDFREAFGKSERQGLNTSDLRELHKILLRLADGQNSQRQPLLEIRGPEILDDLENHYRNGGTINLLYDKEDFGWYLGRLDSGLREMLAGPDYHLLVFNPRDYEFRFKDKRMSVRPGGGQFGAHALNLCLFLFNHPIHDEDEHGAHVSIADDEWLADYKIGDWVTYKKINEMVFIRGSTDQARTLEETGDQYGAIRSTVFNLNDRAKKTENLGFEVFETRGNQHQLRVKLPPS